MLNIIANKATTKSVVASNKIKTPKELNVVNFRACLQHISNNRSQYSRGITSLKVECVFDFSNMQMSKTSSNKVPYNKYR